MYVFSVKAMKTHSAIKQKKKKEYNISATL